MNHAQLEALRLLGASCAGAVGGLALFLGIHWLNFWRKTRNPFALAPVTMNTAVFITMAAIVTARIILSTSQAPLSVGDVTTWIVIAVFAVAETFQFRNLAAAQNFYEKLT